MRREAFGIVMTLAVLAGIPASQAWGFAATHELINDQVFKESRIDEYFHDQMGFPLGPSGRISQTFQNTLPLDLFVSAGTAEDKPPRRTWNHFHDPLRDWEHAGFTKALFPDGISNILWAQYGLVQRHDWFSEPNDEWNWQEAYAYFLSGLTNQDPAVREWNLAKLFTALGHLTHLLADVSVPEHSRNDGHVVRAYEAWCADNLPNTATQINGVPVFQPAFGPDRAIFQQDRGEAFGSGALSPVSNLWDSHVAAGDNPRLGVFERLVGLADYTNYNYFSGDTIFRNYQHPSRDEVGLTLLPTPGRTGELDYLLYFNRTASDGVFVEHLAAAGIFFSDLQELGYLDLSIAHLDDLCYQDYATNLVPRAVSYGTALVDYFFRARFDVTAEGNILTVTNRSPGKATGVVTVYADVNGMRLPEYSYNVALEPNASFTSDDFSPTETEGFRYLAVFEGQMEDGGSVWSSDSAVAGRIFTWDAAPPADVGRQVYAVGNNPMGLAVTPDGSRVLVANYSDDAVSVLDARGTDVIATLAVGDGPYDIAIAGGYAFVSNEREGSISVVNLADLSVTTPFTHLPAYPREIAASPDGTSVYCAHWSASQRTLSKIDVPAMTLSLLNDNLDFRMMMTGIALHPTRPRGYALYYAYFWRKSVAAFDTNSDTKIVDVPGPDLNRSGAVESGGTYLYYVSGFLDQVSRLDTNSNAHAPAIPLESGSNARRVSAGSDGRVYVTLYGRNKVLVLDGSSGSTRATIEDGELSGPAEAVASPDNTVLFVSSSLNNKVLRIPNPLVPAGESAPAPELALFAMAAESAAATSALLLEGLPYEADIRLDERYAPQEAFSDGRHMLSGVLPGWHTMEIVAPGYYPLAQQVFLQEGDNRLVLQLTAE